MVCFILNNLHNSIFYVSTRKANKSLFFYSIWRLLLYDICTHTHIIQKKAFWGLLSLGKAHEHWKGSFDNGQGQIWQRLNFHIQQQWVYFKKKMIIPFLHLFDSCRQENTWMNRTLLVVHEQFVKTSLNCPFCTCLLWPCSVSCKWRVLEEGLWIKKKLSDVFSDFFSTYKLYLLRISTQLNLSS